MSFDLSRLKILKKQREPKMSINHSLRPNICPAKCGDLRREAFLQVLHPHTWTSVLKPLCLVQKTVNSYDQFLGLGVHTPVAQSTLQGWTRGEAQKAQGFRGGLEGGTQSYGHVPLFLWIQLSLHPLLGVIRIK